MFCDSSIYKIRNFTTTFMTSCSETSQNGQNDKSTIESTSDITNKPERKAYVTKLERQRFIRWYLDTYGHNANMKDHSAEKLSSEYKRLFNIYIPKITIHRWIHNMRDDELQDYSSMYIVEGIQQVSDHILNQ